LLIWLPGSPQAKRLESGDSWWAVVRSIEHRPAALSPRCQRGECLMRRARLVLIAALIPIVASLVPGAALAQGPFADPAFADTWTRTDAPVSNGQTSRTYYWGPCTSTPGGQPEQLIGAPGNQRLVQYLDKSRMEINNPQGDRDSPWFVTNGLLANELITGRIQTGYATFETRAPSDQSVTGDPGDRLAPTYRALGRVLPLPPRPAGGVITETLDHDGNIGVNPGLSQYNVTSADLLDVTNHRLASVFRDFLLSRGPVILGGQLVTAPLADPTFFVTGYPTSEAYWTRAAIGGVIKDVLVQVFERRVLTYVPSNQPNFQVEMGNIGLHYRAWRYGASLNYFGALVGNTWTYANSGSGLDTTYQVVDLDAAFKPGQTLLRVTSTNLANPANATTEYWQELNGQLLFHGLRLASGETVKYDPPYVVYRYCMDVGQEWSTTTQRSEPLSGRTNTVTYSFKVEGAELVQTPAGAYPTFRIQRTDNDTANGALEQLTIWFSPYIGLVKRQILDFDFTLKQAALR
jgi:hypothetical protein